jgi:P-type conjugative transfer protein TrbJ
MRRLLCCLVLFLVSFLGLSVRCEAQIPVTDAAHIAVSIFNEVERFLQAVDDFFAQTEQIFNQVEQIRFQVQALAKLDVHAWRDLFPAFSRLVSLIEGADAVLYNAENLEERFFETFPAGEGYENYTDDSWRALSRTLETLRLSVESVREITSSDELDLESLAAIEAEIEGAQGHEEVLEGIGDLLSWTAKQSLLAERINAAQTNADTVAKAYEINEAARSRETYTEFLDKTLDDSIDPAMDESAPAFRALPGWMPR